MKVAYQHPSVRLIPQLGFPRKDTGGYVYFTLSEIKKGLELDNLNVGNGIEVKIIANTKDEYEELISFLKEINMPFGEERKFSSIKLDNGKLNVNIEFIIDTILARGVAKIGFNYMANMCGGTFACHDDFNMIRQFIRYDKTPLGELRETIEPSNQPILEDESSNRRRLGHILGLMWDIKRRHVLAKVSLFNSITWTVMLAKDFSGIFREIKSGHFYDIQNLTVNQRPVIPREQIPYQTRL